ncbi:MAG TPA: hypothetical protein PK530_14175 [Anaerolineales bacterium]|nr:hypothetical protein [Anaerolineales bacterium]
MFRLSISKWLTSLMLLTVLVTGCSSPATPTANPTTSISATSEPATALPTEVPPTEIVATAEPYPAPTNDAHINGYPAPTESAESGYPAPTESSGPSLVGLPQITLANINQVKMVASIPTFLDARIVWSPDGAKFAVFPPYEAGSIQIYDLTALSLPPVVLSGHAQPITGVAFSPDGTQLASAGQDGMLFIWDVASGAQRSSMDVTSLFQNPTFPDTVTFSPDGTKLALFSAENSTLLIFNYPLDNAPPTTLAWTEHASPVVSVYPSPDWQTFAWVGRGTLVLMNADGTFRGEQINHEDFIMNLFYSPDSQRLFIQTAKTINGANAGVVIVYDVQTGQALQTLAHPDFVGTSTLSPDGTTLATSSANEVNLWDWATGTKTVSISDREDAAQSLAFSSDSGLLAGAFNGGVIEVWDAATGQLVLASDTGEISGVKFVLGGTLLIATQVDGTVLLFGVVP